MTNRILIGKRGSQFGLWCSKPGFDVLTTSLANMMFDMGSRSEQIIQMGFLSVSQLGVPVALGYEAAPLVSVNTIAQPTGGAALIRPYPGGAFWNYWDQTTITPSAFVISIGATPGMNAIPAPYHVGYSYFAYRRRLT